MLDYIITENKNIYKKKVRQISYSFDLRTFSNNHNNRSNEKGIKWMILNFEKYGWEGKNT